MKGVKLWGEKGYSRLRADLDAPLASPSSRMESHPILGSSNQIVDSARARLSLRTVPDMDGRKAGAQLVKKLTRNAALRRQGHRQGERHHALVDHRSRRARPSTPRGAR